MSQFVTTPTKAYPANAAVAQYLRVKLLSTGKFDVAGISDNDIGTLEEASFVAGDMRAIRLRGADGTRKMIASGAITNSADVFADAGGKITATPNPFFLGRALEAAGANNDIIEVQYFPHPLRIMRGQLSTITASDTVVTGLNTVASVTASFEDNPGLDPALVSAQVGNQAGAPAAGSIIINTWKFTSNANPTPLAATTFAKKVNWVAVGT